MSAGNHLRKTFITGLFSFVPLAVTVFIVYWIDENTRFISVRAYGRAIPFMGVIITLACIYLCGVFVSSFLGKTLLKLVDKVLNRVPVLREVYTAWKQVALTPAGTEGTFSRVVLVPDNVTSHFLIGFTSGLNVPGSDCICVFLPNAPNPMVGRLLLIKTGQCKYLDLSPDEAFKLIISTGNYIPPNVGEHLNLT